VLASFIVGLFNLYEDLYFTYLEINPLGKSQSLPDRSFQDQSLALKFNRWELGA
jgi:succinyl-CoA synthetase beta subunit